MPPTTRFAPSPTGKLHLGHAVSAIRAHDFARNNAGRFLVRIEDIDPGRSRPEHVTTILTDLAWLGLSWDGPVLHQSTRLPAYAAALDQLRAAKLLYPCTCTRAEIAAEIAASASAPHGPAAIYPGTCRRRAPDPTRVAAWRLDMAAATSRAGPFDWHDATAGTVRATPEHHGDVVLARRDAPASYHLAVTLDDAHQGVTDIVRGVDLFEATHVHRLLQALLGLPVPRYHHHPLMLGPDGRRLAKRDGAPAIADLRSAGQDGAALAAELRAAIALSAPAATLCPLAPRPAGTISP
ncbi:tRNA glutamyl-Q(34) synthetase GluQRS [Sphingomonas prati]|uniref:Glutamyl-Q tRNA(Asp) synthetase n=1 Tax=Sphingomonas prati TaxID=1843237 RepID=A0A7W9F2T3_9SPHN|nr:tRNA glutamyl-Q(34) synthetase GluQRS [Sphingomonas prati]MBB5728795.1 glutamyl-Q tRNA(Asp) synthetase [Sphingomonas prati]GGE87476.1 tRNA glutamyl-Q(34) synthetase GluQRS [Sphingomonas prati]